MSSRPWIINQTSTTQPTGQQLGDEWYNPTTNILNKQVAVSGNAVTAAQVVLNINNVVSVTGTVSATSFIGNGSQLTGLTSTFNLCGSRNIVSCISGTGGTGNDNFFAGFCAGRSNTTGGSNTFFG